MGQLMSKFNRKHYRIGVIMLMEEHLVQTFYITKPTIQQISAHQKTSRSQSQSKSQNLNQSKNNSFMTLAKNHTQHQGLNLQHHASQKSKRTFKLYKMIKTQTDLSASLKLMRSQKKSKQLKKKKKVKQNYKFIEQFHSYFKTFVKHQQCSTERVQDNIQTQTTKVDLNQNHWDGYNIRKNYQIAEQGFFEESIRRQVPQTYYQKLKRNVVVKVNDVLNKTTPKTCYDKVDMLNDKKQVDLHQLLRQQKGLQPENNIKLTKSGLTIHSPGVATDSSSLDIHSIDNAKTNSRIMKYSQQCKAKKDLKFRKGLSLNSKIILNELQAYQEKARKEQHVDHRITSNGLQVCQHIKSNELEACQQIQNKSTRKTKKNQYFKVPSCGRQLSTKVKFKNTQCFQGSNSQDLMGLRLKQKCLGISLECAKQNQQANWLKKGLEKFAEYCLIVSCKMGASKTRLESALRTQRRSTEPNAQYQQLSSLDNVIMRVLANKQTK